MCTDLCVCMCSCVHVDLYVGRGCFCVFLWCNAVASQLLSLYVHTCTISAHMYDECAQCHLLSGGLCLRSARVAPPHAADVETWDVT